MLLNYIIWSKLYLSGDIALKSLSETEDNQHLRNTDKTTAFILVTEQTYWDL